MPRVHFTQGVVLALVALSCLIALLLALQSSQAFVNLPTACVSTEEKHTVDDNSQTSTWASTFSDFTCTHTVGGPICKREQNGTITCEHGPHPTSMCIFQNVCLSPTGQLVYYLDPKANVSTLPPPRIELGANGVKVEINISRSIPPPMTNSNLAMVSQHYPRNWGHALLDEVLPLFLVLQGLGFPLDSSTLVATDTPAEYRSPYELLVPKENVRSLTESYGACYRNIGAGITELMYSRRGFKSMQIGLRLFRSHVMRRFNISRPCRRNFTVLFVDKDAEKSDHAARWLNIHEIAGQVRTRHPDWQTNVVTWTKVALLEQLKLIQGSHVLVSLPGSDVVSGLLLQDYSAIIMPCRHYNGTFEWSNEFANLFDFLPTTTAVQFCNELVKAAQPNQANVDPQFVLGVLEHFFTRLYASRELHC